MPTELSDIHHSRLIDVESAASMLDMSPAWVRQQVKDQRIPYVKLGGRIKFRAEDIDQYIADQVQNPPIKHPVPFITTSESSGTVVEIGIS